MLSKSKENISEARNPVRILQKNQAEIKNAHCDFLYVNESGMCLHIANCSFSFLSVQLLNILISQGLVLGLTFHYLYSFPQVPLYSLSFKYLLYVHDLSIKKLTNTS